MEKCLPAVLQKFPDFKTERYMKMAMKRTKSIVVRKAQGFKDKEAGDLDEEDGGGGGVGGGKGEGGTGEGAATIEECEAGYLVPSKVLKNEGKEAKKEKKKKKKKKKGKKEDVGGNTGVGSTDPASKAHFDSSANEGLPAFRHRTATTGQYANIKLDGNGHLQLAKEFVKGSFLFQKD
eukprot:gene23097-7225_t